MVELISMSFFSTASSGYEIPCNLFDVMLDLTFELEREGFFEDLPRHQLIVNKILKILREPKKYSHPLKIRLYDDLAGDIKDDDSMFDYLYLSSMVYATTEKKPYNVNASGSGNMHVAMFLHNNIEFSTRFEILAAIHFYMENAKSYNKDRIDAFVAAIILKDPEMACEFVKLSTNKKEQLVRLFQFDV